MFTHKQTIVSPWLIATYDAIIRQCTSKNTQQFNNQSLIKEELEQIKIDTETKGNTPEKTMSRVLQHLRAMNIISFDTSGHYTLLTPRDCTELELAITIVEHNREMECKSKGLPFDPVKKALLFDDDEQTDHEKPASPTPAKKKAPVVTLKGKNK